MKTPIQLLARVRASATSRRSVMTTISVGYPALFQPLQPPSIETTLV
ncbi:MAG: hypothetical protein R3C02_01620 [Planctomycetaceae bacterium]